MAHMKKPKLPYRLTDVPTADDLRRLFGSTRSQSFDDLCDTANIRGVRLDGRAAGRVGWPALGPPRGRERVGDPISSTNDVDLDREIVRFFGKG